MDLDLERINVVEAQKVSRWCSDNGVESSSDLAFFFLTSMMRHFALLLVQWQMPGRRLGLP